MQPSGLGLNFKGPPPFDELEDMSSTHTIVYPRRDGGAEHERLGTLMYNESVQLMVRPMQHSFIEQRPDMFLLKQLDVVRSAWPPRRALIIFCFACCC